jgi:hypothetical protein
MAWKSSASFLAAASGSSWAPPSTTGTTLKTILVVCRLAVLLLDAG